MATTKPVEPKFGMKLGGAAGWGAFDFFTARFLEQKSMGESLWAGAKTTAEWYFFTPFAMAKMGVEMGKLPFTIANSISESNLREGVLNPSNLKQSADGSWGAMLGGNFTDTEQMATLRRRGMQAIQESRLNARSVLGNEARMLHR